MSCSLDRPMVTMSMELLRKGQDPLFLIHANNIVLGNHKYGSLAHSIAINNELIGSGVKAKLFEISCLEKRGKPELPPDSMSFYYCHGGFGCNEIIATRSFPKKAVKRTAYFRESNLLGTHTILEYNRLMRRWSRSRFSKFDCLGGIVSDIINFKLLMHDYLSFHSGGVEIDGKAYLITGLPNTGKSYSIVQLASDGANFMSEDITLIDKNMVAVGLPFTQTLEKRKKLSLFKQVRAAIFQTLYKQNYSKNTFFDTPIYNGKNVCHDAPIAAVFFVKRGETGYHLANKKRILKNLIDLNRLEFTYGRNIGFLTYLLFNGDLSMDDYFEKETKLITSLVDAVPMYDVSAPDHTGFAPVIKRLINELSK